MKHFAAMFCPLCVCVCVCVCGFFFVFVFCFFSILLISNCLYNVCWKLAVMFSNSNHISNFWFPFRTDHGYLTRLAPAIFGWPWSSLFCNCVNLLYTIIIFNIWGLNKAVCCCCCLLLSNKRLAACWPIMVGTSSSEKFAGSSLV